MARRTRHQDRTQNQPPKDWNAAEREKQVVTLRLRGWEFDAIAEQCGYADRSGAHKAWKRYLSRLPVVETEQAREESLHRLNVALNALWDKVLKGDTWAIDRMLAIEKRRAELLGLDKAKEGERGVNTVTVREVPLGLLPMPVEAQNGHSAN